MPQVLLRVRAVAELSSSHVHPVHVEALYAFSGDQIASLYYQAGSSFESWYRLKFEVLPPGDYCIALFDYAGRSLGPTHFRQPSFDLDVLVRVSGRGGLTVLREACQSHVCEVAQSLEADSYHERCVLAEMIHLLEADVVESLHRAFVLAQRLRDSSPDGLRPVCDELFSSFSLLVVLTALHQSPRYDAMWLVHLLAVLSGQGARYRTLERDLLVVVAFLEASLGTNRLDLERALGTRVLSRHFRAAGPGYPDDVQVLFTFLSDLDPKLQWHPLL